MHMLMCVSVPIHMWWGQISISSVIPQYCLPCVSRYGYSLSCHLLFILDRPTREVQKFHISDPHLLGLQTYTMIHYCYTGSWIEYKSACLGGKHVLTDLSLYPQIDAFYELCQVVTWLTTSANLATCYIFMRSILMFSIRKSPGSTLIDLSQVYLIIWK